MILLQVALLVVLCALLVAVVVYGRRLAGSVPTGSTSGSPTLNEMGVWTLVDRLKIAAGKAEEAVVTAQASATQVVERMEVASVKAETAVTVAETAVAVARESAQILESFVPLLDRLEATGIRIEQAATEASTKAAVVADDLERTHERADAVGEGLPGEAADAGSRSPRGRKPAAKATRATKAKAPPKRS